MPYLTPTNLELAAIHPKLGARFSPNLHAFLASKRNATQLRLARVYRDSSGSLWLGYPDDEFFVGARLVSVLCGGARTKTFAFVRLVDDLTEVEGFWSAYARDGRCAVDPKHEMYFVGDDSRWSQQGEVRSCQWCKSAQQRLVRRVETVEHESWV